MYLASHSGAPNHTSLLKGSYLICVAILLTLRLLMDFRIMESRGFPTFYISLNVFTASKGSSFYILLNEFGLMIKAL